MTTTQEKIRLLKERRRVLVARVAMGNAGPKFEDPEGFYHFVVPASKAIYHIDTAIRRLGGDPLT